MYALPAFVARVSPLAQVLWLRSQPLETLQAIHNQHGYGVADCDCPIEWMPCEHEGLTRFQLVALALQREEERARLSEPEALRRAPPLTLAQIGRLKDGRLFAKAFPEFGGAERCDCTPTPRKCIHTAQHFNDGPLSPLAKKELLFLLAPDEYLDPPPPLTLTRCRTTPTKAHVMAQRAEAGFALYHPGDKLHRDNLPPEYMERIVSNLRNGAPNPGDVTLRKAAAA